jgi:hypothetical protein
MRLFLALQNLLTPRPGRPMGTWEFGSPQFIAGFARGVQTITPGRTMSDNEYFVKRCAVFDLVVLWAAEGWL